MRKVVVRLGAKPAQAYGIFIGAGTLKKIAELRDFKGYSKLFLVTDEAVRSPFLDQLKTVLPTDTASIVLPTGEQHKSINTVQTIWKAMQEAGCDRKSLVINLGGGVVCDLGGFAASTYMRGVDFLNVPTTLLAQVDASVGGKTGFNFSGVKNLIGTFNQPTAVIIDTQILAGLPDRQFTAGFAEIIKHGLITDKMYFETVTAKRPRRFSLDELESIIARSCEIKRDAIQTDAEEGGTRKLLNFGHTIGHALEALSLETSSPLLHGEAISVGMLVEARLSEALGLLPAPDVKRIEKALKNAGLPTSVSGFSISRVMYKMRADKKNVRGVINFTLLNSIGRAEYNHQADEAVVKKALNTALGGS